MSESKRDELVFLSAADMDRCLPISAAIDAMRDAFAALAGGDVQMPERLHIDVADPLGTALFMPSYMPSVGAIGIKTVTLFQQNVRRGLPLIHGLFCLFDAATGRPTAVLDAGRLTALRTGAVSGLATDLMARPDARRVAIFGAGIQGRTQLAAVCAVRSIQSADVYDVNPQRAREFADDMTDQLGLPVVAAKSAGAAVRSADVICTATVATDPVFSDSDVPAGVHINAIGSYKPSVQEIPAETVVRARIAVDSRDAALVEAGDLLQPIQQGLMTADALNLELADLVVGRFRGREAAEQITFFKSVGLAIQDLTAAHAALKRAQTLGLGTRVPVCG